MNKTIAMDTLLEPPTTSRSVRFHPQQCHGLALQKYLLLQEQQESLRQHLDELRPTRQPAPILYTPVSPSPATSPTSTRRRMSRSPDGSTPPRSPQHNFSLPVRKGSYPAGGIARSGSNTDLLDHHNDEVALEEAKLCDVNESMKRALTELLNSESVRADRAFRTWVQCRLMDTERELRSGRRRRSAPGA